MDADLKYVILIDRDLPAGLAANTAAMLAFTAGSLFPDMVGKETADQEGDMHSGLLQIPLPVLKAEQNFLQQLMQKKKERKLEDCFLIDFTTLAQSCRTYPEFENRLGRTPGRELKYSGLLLAGPKKKIRSQSGDLPLYR